MKSELDYLGSNPGFTLNYSFLIYKISLIIVMFYNIVIGLIHLLRIVPAYRIVQLIH